MLNTSVFGSPGPRPLIIAHGLFGSARNWSVISKRLSDSRHVIAVDMRNHGGSPWYAGHSYQDLADDLAEVILASGGTADVLGHSMGGKAAMVLATGRPDLVGRLIVADIAPKAHDHTQLHLIHAMKAIDLSAVSSRRNADAQLQAYEPQEAVRAFLLQSLDLTGDHPRWRLNLDALENNMEYILGFQQVSGTYEGPSLFVTGGASPYVTEVDHARILELFPKAQFSAIEGAGHWLHAEKPREFEAVVRQFLD